MRIQVLRCTRRPDACDLADAPERSLRKELELDLDTATASTG